MIDWPIRDILNQKFSDVVPLSETEICAIINMVSNFGNNTLGDMTVAEDNPTIRASIIEQIRLIRKQNDSQRACKRSS